jgi:hypothetical protein
MPKRWFEQEVLAALLRLLIFESVDVSATLAAALIVVRTVAARPAVGQSAMPASALAVDDVREDGAVAHAPVHRDVPEEAITWPQGDWPAALIRVSH